jgi:hypothetical protein
LLTPKSILAINNSCSLSIRFRLPLSSPTGFRLQMSAKKLLTPLMCSSFKSYPWSCIIQRVTLPDAKWHFFKNYIALLSEYTAIGWPTTYILNFWSA